MLTALSDGYALNVGDEIYVNHVLQDDGISFKRFPEGKMVKAMNVYATPDGRVYVTHELGHTPIDMVRRSAEYTHVDDFVYYQYCSNEYARFFFLLNRLPAALKMDFQPFIAQYKLFARCGDVWYRVTGASRMGDVWLSLDFDRTHGYDKRVLLEYIQEWSQCDPVTGAGSVP